MHVCTGNVTRHPPEAECGVGEEGRAVEVTKAEATPDIIHGGQGEVGPLHNAPPQGPLTGAITQGHQAVVLIQTATEEDRVMEW